MKRFAILGLLLLPFAVGGCSSLCFWRSTTTEVTVLDEDLNPVTTVQVKGKLVEEFALTPRKALENLNPEPASPRPAAARRPAERPAKAKPAQDDKMRISYDGGIMIRILCQQKFLSSDVFPGRGGDWHTVHPDVTADGYLDPEIVGPILNEVRERNQARLAANPNLRLDELEFVCFNFHSPTGERFARHLTNDGKWALPTPTGAGPGGRIVLTGGVHIVGEIADTETSDHKVGAHIHAYCVIPH